MIGRIVKFAVQTLWAAIFIVPLSLHYLYRNIPEVELYLAYYEQGITYMKVDAFITDYSFGILSFLVVSLWVLVSSGKLHYGGSKLNA